MRVGRRSAEVDRSSNRRDHDVAGAVQRRQNQTQTRQTIRESRCLPKNTNDSVTALNIQIWSLVYTVLFSPLSHAVPSMSPMAVLVA